VHSYVETKANKSQVFDNFLVTNTNTVTNFVTENGQYKVHYCGALPLPGKSYWWGRLSTVDLTSLDQLVFILKILFSFFYKTSYLNEEVNSAEPSSLVSIPCPYPQTSL
jgi:hypothetical protein